MKFRKRIVIAGQIPPPVGGQNAMILQLLEDMKSRQEVETEHLAFCFTPDNQSARQGKLGKIVELFRVIFRLVSLRFRGPIDLLVFPSGGPQTVPLVRDLLLVPWILLFSRRAVLHFHAAGFADALKEGSLLASWVASLYRRFSDAIVMADFNRRDPLACGIKKIHVLPFGLKDEYSAGHIDRGGNEIRILSVGHLCPDKGTPRLIKAFANLKKQYPEAILELAGEPLAPYTHDALQQDLKEAGVSDSARLLGLVRNESKCAAFGRAHFFVFASVAPYESFGLVLTEAMMWQLPIIASNWRGNADVLKNSQGAILFSPPDSVEALTEALEKMLRLSERWADMGNSNRQSFLQNYHDRRTDGSLPDRLIEMAFESSVEKTSS